MSDGEAETLVDQDPDFREDFGHKAWPFSEKGGVDEIPVPTGAACSKISSILGRANENAGDFSFGGQAGQLPAVPGIFVDGVGPVPVPLWEERARRLIEKCEKSSFGHNMDTKMDENVRKSWELQPSQVHFKNPLWETGIEKMALAIGDRLGYKNIPLQCVLYKLLVYGEGGHFLKHQDTEKEDGMIATLIVQPPSLHEGGDLVVFRNGKVKRRHDFGKAGGTATFLPHYAVHYADAEHAVEKVTMGYRLALVYSVCLPLNMLHLERNPNKPMSRDLTEAIETMTGRDNSFTLLLDHQYTDKSIGGFGSGALKGIDRARFLALEAAINSVSAEKKLKFHIVKLYHHIVFYSTSGGCIGDWNEHRREEKTTWYSSNGSQLGDGDDIKLKFNFLNPAMETYSQLWQKPFGSCDIQGYLGNEGPSKDSVYSRFAITAWPEVCDIEFTMKFITLRAGFHALQQRVQVHTANLQNLMEMGSTKLVVIEKKRDKKLQREPWNTRNPPVLVSVEMCQVLCQQLHRAGNPTLVSYFFKDFFRRLNGKRLVLSDIIKLVKKFSWTGVGSALLSALDSNNEGNMVETTLVFAKDFERGEAQQALSALAVERIVRLPDNRVSDLWQRHDLWSVVLSSGDGNTLHKLSCKLQQMSPRFLDIVTNRFSAHLQKNDLPDDMKLLFVAIIYCRIEWLQNQICVLEKPFSWSMPVAEFPDSDQVEKFLRGPEAEMTIAAEPWYESVDTCYRSGKPKVNSSFNMSTSMFKTVRFVTLSKTRAWYDKNQENLPSLKKEMRDLMDATVDTLVRIISKWNEARQK
ncbi:unnamed protein product [Phytophthora fragariaefolia]|uniref:Unnamed protein product n=1 Tax=Phytophthora fragariaefolia TaxID=1490495 RepID=A0A9W6XWI6_9STRA|nr:unnamed protein product [Phytophthora fragariaefolia]